MPNLLQQGSACGNFGAAGSTQFISLEECVEQYLVFPVTFATADATVLFTVPTGVRVKIGRMFWEVTTGWTGGSSSAIGCRSSNTAYNTKGDLLGGASGDVAATLVTATANGFCGTIGAKLSSQALVVLVAGDTIKFDQITSAFTAGVANIICPMAVFPAN